MKGIILQASSASDGYTAKAVRALHIRTGFDVVDLKKLEIGQFDYAFKHKNDDFLPLMRRITADFDCIIFATPVYWYSMSGILKAFFDRITDCLDLEKETGRKLRGMSMGLLSCSQDEALEYDFEMPFRLSAGYLGMQYIGSVHVAVNKKGLTEGAMPKLKAFTVKLGQRTKN